MSRAPYQVLVFPYRKHEGEYQYLLFQRIDSEGGYWQEIAGGGEDNETPLEAAKREAYEEAKIPTINEYIKLDTVSSIPIVFFEECEWDEDKLVIPEYCYSVYFEGIPLLSDEHKNYRWVSYTEAINLLKWDSNKTAIWELNTKLINKKGRK